MRNVEALRARSPTDPDAQSHEVGIWVSGSLGLWVSKVRHQRPRPTVREVSALSVLSALSALSALVSRPAVGVPVVRTAQSERAGETIPPAGFAPRARPRASRRLD